jgi:hypothetical protein
VSHDKRDKARAVSLENLAVITEIRDQSSQAASLAHLSSIYEQAGFDLADPERTALQLLTRKL